VSTPFPSEECKNTTMLNIDDKLQTYALGIVVSPGDSADLLIKSLASVQLQSEKPDEIVLLRNGILSPLQNKIIKEFVSNSSVAVSVISQDTTTGFGTALNSCLGNIKSEYFIRQDPDDLSKKDRIKKIKQFNAQEEYDLIYSSYVEFNREKKLLQLQRYTFSESGFLNNIFIRNTIGHSTVVLKKSLVQDLGGYSDIFLAEDYHLWLRFLENKAHFGSIDDPLVVFDSTNVAKKRSSLKLLGSELTLLFLKLRVRPKLFYKVMFGFLLRLIFLFSPKVLKQFYYERNKVNRSFDPADCLDLELACSKMKVDDFKKDLKLSIIIPHYNRIDSLLAALKSIENQKLNFDHEIIVVDDFSDTQCLRELDHLEFKNLKIIKSDYNSGGPAKPRNLGISASSGEMVAFLDSDDEWNVNHIYLSLDRVINGNPCANAHTGWFYPRSVSNIFLLVRNILVTSSVMMPRNLILEGDFFPVYSDNSIYEDYVAWLKVSRFRKFLITPSKTVTYNLNSIDSYRKKYKKDFICVKNSYLAYILWLVKRNEQISLFVKVIMGVRLLSISLIALFRKSS
jgi:glycosyltransferase involved in cell wall biosynthesis